MANIHFLSTPGLVALSGNEARFVIVGRNTFITSGGIAANLLQIEPSQPVDSKIVLSWGTKTVTFTAKINPDDSGFQYPYREGIEAEAPLAYYNTMLEYLSKNVAFTEDFFLSVVSNPNRISIVARKSGSDYNLTLTQQIPSTGLLIYNTDVASDTLSENYGIGVKVELDGEFITEHLLPAAHLKNTAEIITSLPGGFDIDKSGMATIDISELAQKEQRGNFTFPFPDAGYGTFFNLMTSCRIYAFEFFGNPPARQGGIFSGFVNILQGKLGNLSIGDLNYQSKTFTDMLHETGMFLSLAPLQKSIDIYAPERVNFLFLADGIFKLVVKQYFSDSSVTTDILETITVTKYSIREYFVAYAKIRTTQKNLVKYDVWIADESNNIVSEIRTLALDYRYQDHARYFLFKNRFGVYEVLRTTGKAVKMKSITKEFSKIPLPENFTSLDRIEKQIYTATETTYTINFGYFATKEDADYAQEFLSSDDVFWLKKGKAYPVSILANKSTVDADGDFNPAASFELTHQIHDDFTEQFTANEPIIVGDFSIDFNTDFFSGNIPTPPAAVKFYNDAQSANFTRNNCASGTIGSVVVYFVPGKKYFSTISQADANQKALDDIATNGQAFANTTGTCNLAAPSYYYNVMHHQVFAKNDCGGISVGSETDYIVPAGRYSSTISQADADQQALNEIAANGQTFANISGSCVWSNAQKSGTIAKNDCSLDHYGSDETLVVNEGTYTSTISQVDADTQAQQYIDANLQNYANANGTCIVREDVILTIIPNGFNFNMYANAADPSLSIHMRNGFGNTYHLLKGLTYQFEMYGTWEMNGIQPLGLNIPQGSIIDITITGNMAFNLDTFV